MQMVRQESEWAANMIQEAEKKIEKLIKTLELGKYY